MPGIIPQNMLYFVKSCKLFDNCKMETTMKTIIFDMYGVIMEHPTGNMMPFINGAFPELTESDVYPHWIRAAKGGLKSRDFWKLIGCKNVEEIEEVYLNTIGINEDFYGAAAKLKDNYSFALLSNDISEWNHFLRKKYGLDPYFDAITVSGDVKLMKPDPEIFRLVLSKLNVSASDCIYIDDRRSNLSAASELGMDVILFNSRAVEYDGKTVYGFDELTELLK
jgi:haloacid dehalogenase superfamily, subfamily IA, variant 3 with third motif having DD or ED